MEKQSFLETTDADKIYFKGHRLSDIMNTVPVWAIHRIEEFLGKDFIFSTVKDSESFLPRLDINKSLVPAKNDQKGDVTIYDCLGKSRVLSKHLVFIINMYNKQGLDIIFAEDNYVENIKLEKNSGLNKDKNYCIVNTFDKDAECVNIYTGPPSMIGRGLLGAHNNQPLFVIDKTTSKEKSISYGGFHYSSFRLKNFYIDFLKSKFGMDSLTTDDGKNKEKIELHVNNSIKKIKDKFCYHQSVYNQNLNNFGFHISYDENKEKIIVYCANGINPELEISLPEYTNEKQFLKALKETVETKIESLFGDWLFRKEDQNKIPCKLQTTLNNLFATKKSDHESSPFSIVYSEDRKYLIINGLPFSRTALRLDDSSFKEMFLKHSSNAISLRNELYQEIRSSKILEKIDSYMMFGSEWIDEFQFKSPFGDVLAPPGNTIGNDWIFRDHESYKQKINEVLKEMEQAADYCEYVENIEMTLPSTFLNMSFDLGIEITAINTEYNKMEDIFSKFIFDTYTNTVSFYSPEACEKLFECTAQELYNKEILAEKMQKFLVSYKDQYDTETRIAKCIMKLIPDDFKDKVITNKVEWNEKYSSAEDMGRIFVSNEEILFNNFYWNQDEMENNDDLVSDFDNIYIDEHGDFSEIEEATAHMFALLGATTKPLSTNVGKLTEIIKSDAEIVAKRIAAEKIIILVQKLMASLLHKTKKFSKTDVEKFFNSVYGKAVIGVSASFVLKSLNNKFDSRYSFILEEISEELRVSSETEIASELVEKLAGMFSPGLSSGSNSMEFLVRVVSEATESSPFNQEDVSDYAVSNVGLRAAANN